MPLPRQGSGVTSRYAFHASISPLSECARSRRNTSSSSNVAALSTMNAICGEALHRPARADNCLGARSGGLRHRLISSKPPARGTAAACDDRGVRQIATRVRYMLMARWAGLSPYAPLAHPIIRGAPANTARQRRKGTLTDAESLTSRHLGNKLIK